MHPSNFSVSEDSPFLRLMALFEELGVRYTAAEDVHLENCESLDDRHYPFIRAARYSLVLDGGIGGPCDAAAEFFFDKAGGFVGHGVWE